MVLTIFVTATAPLSNGGKMAATRGCFCLIYIFAYFIHCSLVKTKNRDRGYVAVDLDFNKNDADICIVIRKHLNADIQDSVV